MSRRQILELLQSISSYLSTYCTHCKNAWHVYVKRYIIGKKWDYARTKSITSICLYFLLTVNSYLFLKFRSDKILQMVYFPEELDCAPVFVKYFIAHLSNVTAIYLLNPFPFNISEKYSNYTFHKLWKCLVRYHKILETLTTMINITTLHSYL